MHTTLEAVYDPKTGLQFVEPVQFDKPVRVLVTIIDTPFIDKPSESNLLQKLISIHQISYSTHRSEIEIDNYIQAHRDSWD
jgi:hypothetical protein